MDSKKAFLIIIIITLIILHPTDQALLSPDFYESSCPAARSIVRGVVERALESDGRIGASLIRLHFHDCFVQGCDASILLDNKNGSIESEKDAAPNLNTARGFDVVDEMKNLMERTCPKTVSCADILALAAEAGVSLAGGPSWMVELGRRDGTTASRDGANKLLPGPSEPLEALVTKFGAVGLSATDLVALSGAHTFGRAQCRFFSPRLYSNPPDPTLNATYAAALRRICPEEGDRSSVVTDLDATTGDTFDSRYFSNLQSHKGLLKSDQVLFSAATAQIVHLFSRNQTAFFQRFVEGMVQMGRIRGINGQGEGEVRLNCRRVNTAG